ncbi:MAG: phosphoethanolamine transferase, partial [Moraxellaceae bacterium]
YQGLSSLARNHKELRHYLYPNNLIGGFMAYGKSSTPLASDVVKVGADISKGSSWQAKEKPVLLVLVIGETARAENFSLYGYARKTNPDLEKINDLIVLQDVQSCGTETAVSLPCMLSVLGRADYSLAKAAQQENLLDMVHRAGIQVHWIDNQSGCKNTCVRVETESTASADDPTLCRGGECHDEILVKRLQAFLASNRGDAMVVLHQMGSHGPAYYKRYPDNFAVFAPTCRTSLLDKCTSEEIVNAYDNTIRYTDHVLASIIDTLKRHQQDYATAMIYMSDHGESLGEYGLYLHGAPYVLAPSQQTRVPALLWLSSDIERQRRIDSRCLAQQRNKPYSHDNLVHSVLGLMDLHSTVYQIAQDIFAACRAGENVAS